MRITRISTASSPQVMHPVVWSHRGMRPSLICLDSFLHSPAESAAWSRDSGGSSFDHAPLQFPALLLVVLAHALEQGKRGASLPLIDLGDREADVDQHPVAGF